jgi:YidC/Oxa1 family membrane protein insertase
MFDVLIVKPIFNALLLIYSAIPGGDFGIALILFTILIRFLLYPLVKKQLHQTKLMQKLQPELKKIKERAKGNKQLEATQMMELYKRYGVSPFRSIGILLIQLPIFIALYQVIQIFTIHRDRIAHFTYDSLENIPAIKSLIENPDDFNTKMLGFIDLTKTTFSNGSIDITLLLLAVIAAVTQYIMTKQTMPTTDTNIRFRDIMKEASDGKRHDQSDVNAAVMQNMAKFMPIMMFFIMVTLPGALALYYVTSNVVAVIQQHYLLNKDEEELEEIADAPTKEPRKRATAKARERDAREGNVTRITANDTRKKKEKRS